MAVVTVPLVDVTAVTPRSRLVSVDLRGHVFNFQPGQAVMVAAHGHSEPRPYSIASSPEQTAETGRLELLIAVESNGNRGANLSTAAPGTLIDVEGPMGTFTLPLGASDDRLLFIAGGTGIAPLRSMIDHLLRDAASPRISLLYSARRSDEFAFIDELRDHAAAGKIALHQTVTREEDPSWLGRRGRIGRTHFGALLHEPLATLCFVCGPEPLVNESVSTLKALGVPEAQIRTERWGK